MKKGEMDDLKFTLKANYTLLCPLDGTYNFNWGYITALTHYSVINDCEYMEAYDFNRDLYCERGGK